MREKQRAKDEVNRLNGVVSGSSPASGGPSGVPNQEAPTSSSSSSDAAGAPWRRRPIFHPPPNDARSQVTPAERRRQLAQLAEMGIAVPEEFRGDLAMAGDWQVVSERVIHDHDHDNGEEGVKKEEDGEEGNEERKYAAAGGLSIGVRKRKYKGQRDEEEGGGGDEVGEMMAARRGWGSGSGSRLQNHSTGSRFGEEDDLDTLLGKTKVRIKDESHDAGSDSSPSVQPPTDEVPTTQNPHLTPPIKQEDNADETETETKTLLPAVTSGNTLNSHDDVESNSNSNLKQDPDTPLEQHQHQQRQQQEPGIIFKKRKAKPIRNR